MLKIPTFILSDSLECEDEKSPFAVCLSSQFLIIIFNIFIYLETRDVFSIYLVWE